MVLYEHINMVEEIDYQAYNGLCILWMSILNNSIPITSIMIID